MFDFFYFKSNQDRISTEGCNLVQKIRTEPFHYSFYNKHCDFKGISFCSIWSHMKYPAFIFIFSFLAFIMVKNGKFQAKSVSPPQGVRDLLTATELLNGDFQHLIHNDYFMPVGDTLQAEHQLSGVILLSGIEMLTDHPDCDWK